MQNWAWKISPKDLRDLIRKSVLLKGALNLTDRLVIQFGELPMQIRTVKKYLKNPQKEVYRYMHRDRIKRSRLQKVGGVEGH